jgi:Family of unknown function (DUF6491)
MIRASLTGFRWTAGLLPLLAGASALGQEGDDAPFDRTPQDCVIVSTIRQTDAIDDQNIIFRMRGNRVYRNHLPRTCPGLARENRIAYRTSTSRLCSIDMITVLEQFGVELRPGFTCRLGEFVPLSPAEVEELEAREDGRAGQSSIEASSIELPQEGDPAAAEGEPVAPEDAPPGVEGEPPDAEN